MSEDAAGHQNPESRESGDQNPADQNSESQKPGDQNPGDQNPESQKPGDQNPESQKPGSQKPESQKPPLGSVFSLGWLMAQLFGPLRPQSSPPPSAAVGGTAPASPAAVSGTAPAGSAAPAHLPAVGELSTDEQTDLAVRELGILLQDCGPDLASSDGQGVRDAWQKREYAAFDAAVQDLHHKILRQLTGDEQKIAAYQLGSALNDLCWLPGQARSDVFLGEFSRPRLATLQAWLAKASATLPPLSAPTVSRSLQNWQDWTDINASRLAGGWAGDGPLITAALQTQGQAWHALLASPTDISGQTSVGAWVEAGESILRSTRLLGLRILRRFWPVVVVILAATGGLLYVVSANTQGTSAVWASLVTVAGAFGVSGASLRAAAKRAYSGLEQDLTRAAVMDARAWSVTWLPTLPQGLMQRHELRSRGVDAPHVKKGLETARPPAAVFSPERTS
jgi:hypothetical protein